MIPGVKRCLSHVVRLDEFLFSSVETVRGIAEVWFDTPASGCLSHHLTGTDVFFVGVTPSVKAVRSARVRCECSQAATEPNERGCREHHVLAYTRSRDVTKEFDFSLDAFVLIISSGSSFPRLLCYFLAGGQARVKSKPIGRDLCGRTQLQSARLHRLPHARAQACLPAGLRGRRLVGIPVLEWSISWGPCHLFVAWNKETKRKAHVRCRSPRTYCFKVCRVYVCSFP